MGYFLEGAAKIGAYASINVSGQKTTAKITGIDWGKLDAEGNVVWGLLLSFEDKKFEAIVKTEKLSEQIIDVLF